MAEYESQLEKRIEVLEKILEESSIEHNELVKLIEHIIGSYYNLIEMQSGVNVADFATEKILRHFADGIMNSKASADAVKEYVDIALKSRKNS